MTLLATAMRRPTLLLVGCGDVGLRVVRLLRQRWRVLALTRDAGRVSELRSAGALPLVADLDRPDTLGRLAGLADAVLHLAPPPAHGRRDGRTRALLQALARGGRVRRMVYASTTGVYGDAGGALFDETRTVRPTTDRAARRVDAEALVRWHGRAGALTVSILRVPGIYAFDRPGGDPRERLWRGAPVLRPQDDVYTNHIHADDLARACIAALYRGRPQRVVHVCDESRLLMGDHFDHVADLCGLARPARISREQAWVQLSAMQMSFLSESRQLRNDRLKRELRVRLRYPTVDEAWFALG